jgi:hypothetical protein
MTASHFLFAAAAVFGVWGQSAGSTVQQLLVTHTVRR